MSSALEVATPSDASPPREAAATPVSSSSPISKARDHDIHLKSEYILEHRHPCLTPIPDRKPEDPTMEPNYQKPKQQQKQKQKQNRHKKNVKNSSKRGRDGDTLSDMKVCKQLMIGNECPFGEECKYSHDMKLMLSVREDDITTVESGCPHFNIKGMCPYGVSCRVGKHHLNLSTGENLTHALEDGEEIIMVRNNVSYDILSSLRKNKYDFVCQRYRPGHKKQRPGDRNAEKAAAAKAKELEEKEKLVQGGEEDVASKKSDDNEAVQTQPVPVDLSPLPKMKKLIDFRNKVYVAPLTTVGNLPFRRIMKKYGADITCGEMAVATNLLQGRTGEWALLKRHRDEDIFGIQIAAAHADVYERISEVIQKENIEIDFLDMNLGCPIDVICQTGAGAKLMQRDHTLRDAVAGMGKNLDCPITIKIRTGWDESKPFAHKLFPKIQRWGMGNVGAVMVHGRSRLQRYSKLANWDYIQKVAGSQSSDMDELPLIGNGDIFSFIDYEEKVLKHEGLSPTAMIGRGALIKPWLPTEIKERRHWDISATERLDVLKDFVRFGLEHWGSDNFGVNNTRRFLLEWLSFLCRYIPVGLLEVHSIPQAMNQRPPRHICGRSDLETLMMSTDSTDWIKISEMLLGPVREGFEFQPKHRATSYK